MPRNDANDIVRRAWRELPRRDRDLLKAISAYELSGVAWHEWGHALSIDRADEEDIAAGERYVELLPEGLARLIRQAGYRHREYTHEVVADIYAILMIRRRQGKTGRPPWLHPEVYELVRRVAGWNQ